MPVNSVPQLSKPERRGTQRSAPAMEAGAAEERQSSIVDTVMEALSDRILSGVYRPGRRLVEAELMRDLNAGRGSVREALRRLQASRLIVVEHNRGALVADPTPEEIRAALEVREVVFGLAARGAARAQPEQAEAAHALLAAVQREMQDGTLRDHPARNRAFHDGVHAMSGNPHIPLLMEQFRLPGLHQHYLRTMDQDIFRESVLEHWQICRAIVRGDAEAAESLARLHERGKVGLALHAATHARTGVDSPASSDRMAAAASAAGGTA